MVDLVSTKVKLATATMKYIAAFLLFAGTVCHGLRLPTAYAEDTLNDEECPAVFSCKDCSTARVCRPEEASGKLVFLKDSACPTVRPWCDADSGTCTDKVPPRCGATDQFVCLKNNQYFPDTNCHQFHFCDDKYEAKLFQCNPNTKVFNPITQQCDDPSVTKCGSFDCKNSAAKKTQHTDFLDFYAMCNNEGVNSAPVAINVCPDMYVLNVTSQKCDPDCNRFSSLNIPDIEDCHNYYHCKSIYINSGEKYTIIEKHTCPTGFAYDSQKFRCEDQGTVDACNKKK